MGRLLRRFLVLVVALLVVSAPESAPAAQAPALAGVAAITAADPIPDHEAGPAAEPADDDDPSLESDTDLQAEDDADEIREPAGLPPSPPFLFLPSVRLGRVCPASTAPPIVHLEIPKPPPRA